MKSCIVRGLFAIGALLVSVTSAHALTLSQVGIVTGDAESIDVNDSTDQIVIDWSGGSTTATVTFSVSETFNLTLVNYEPESAGSNVSGYSFVRQSDGHVFTTNQSCAGIGACNYITGSGSTGGNATSADKPGTLLFALLDPGTYVLGFRESATPSSGTVSFSVAAVPLPAAAWLFISAVSGLLIVGRRRRAAVPALA